MLNYHYYYLFIYFTCKLSFELTSITMAHANNNRVLLVTSNSSSNMLHVT
jgi:hypothetical protein